MLTFCSFAALQLCSFAALQLCGAEARRESHGSGPPRGAWLEYANSNRLMPSESLGARR
jgi:hypothetical protein